MDAQTWWKEAVESANQSLLYHQKEHIKEIQRTAERNAWRKGLRESLA